MKRGKGVYATKSAILPSGRTTTMLHMYDPKQIKIPNRWNTPPYNTMFEPAPLEASIVKTPDSKGAGSKFIARRHPASKPLKFGPLSTAAQ